MKIGVCLAGTQHSLTLPKVSNPHFSIDTAGKMVLRDLSQSRARDTRNFYRHIWNEWLWAIPKPVSLIRTNSPGFTAPLRDRFPIKILLLLDCCFKRRAANRDLSWTIPYGHFWVVNFFPSGAGVFIKLFGANWRSVWIALGRRLP